MHKEALAARQEPSRTGISSRSEAELSKQDPACPGGKSGNRFLQKMARSRPEDSWQRTLLEGEVTTVSGTRCLIQRCSHTGC